MAKIGEGAVMAQVRLGLDELRNAVSLGRDSVEAPTPLGALGHPTPGEVAQARDGEPGHDQEGTLTLASLREAAQEKEGRGQEQSREQNQEREQERGQDLER